MNLMHVLRVLSGLGVVVGADAGAVSVIAGPVTFGVQLKSKVRNKPERRRRWNIEDVDWMMQMAWCSNPVNDTGGFVKKGCP
ncbi:MAG: hypothetical protein ACJAZ9_000958 [Neolewinella sp.]|jgi:hypothetical protein